MAETEALASEARKVLEVTTAAFVRMVSIFLIFCVSTRAQDLHNIVLFHHSNG